MKEVPAISASALESFAPRTRRCERRGGGDLARRPRPCRRSGLVSGGELDRGGKAPTVQSLPVRRADVALLLPEAIKSCAFRFDGCRMWLKNKGERSPASGWAEGPFHNCPKRVKKPGVYTGPGMTSFALRALHTALVAS